MQTFEMGFYEQESKSVFLWNILVGIFYDGQHELCLNSVCTVYVICMLYVQMPWIKYEMYHLNVRPILYWILLLLYFNILFDLYFLAFLDEFDF